MLLTLQLLPLIAMAIIAAVIDFKQRRIPNWLTFSLALGGICTALIWGQPVTPWQAISGLATGFGITFLTFAIGAMGGGDVKLMAAAGAWLGPMGCLQLFIVTSLLGLVIVISQCAYQRRLTRLFKNSMLIVVNLLSLRQVGVEHVQETGQSHKAADHYLPYAVPVLAALLILVGSGWW